MRGVHIEPSSFWGVQEVWMPVGGAEVIDPESVQAEIQVGSNSLQGLVLVVVKDGDLPLIEMGLTAERALEFAASLIQGAEAIK